MWCFSILLMIWIDPLLLLVVSLQSLCHHVRLSNTSQILFHCSVSDNLLSSDNFQLHGVHFVFFSQLLLHHRLLSYLHLSLEVYLVDLSLVEPLEVIWLHSMWRQHTNLSSWVFSHKISIVRELHLGLLLISPCLVLIDFSIFLLLS